MAAGRQGLRVGIRLHEQALHADPAIGWRARTAFQLRQGEQVADQRLHANRLLRHQLQHAPALHLGQAQVHHGLDEARQHRQRCADLVRHVGHEVAPHRVVALALGDVLRQHQFHAVAIAAHQHRDRAAGARASKRHHLIEHARLKIGHECRGPHEVGDALAPIPQRVESEVIRDHAVAPFDLIARVKHHHAGRRGLDGRQKLIESLVFSVDLALEQTQRALDTVGHLAPKASVARRGVVLLAAHPLHQPMRTNRIDNRVNQCADHGTRQRSRGGRVVQATRRHPGQPAEQHPQQAGQDSGNEPVHAVSEQVSWKSHHEVDTAAICCVKR